MTIVLRQHFRNLHSLTFFAVETGVVVWCFENHCLSSLLFGEIVSVLIDVTQIAAFFWKDFTGEFVISTTGLPSSGNDLASSPHSVTVASLVVESAIVISLLRTDFHWEVAVGKAFSS